jgi:hypothetical protein
MIERLPAHEAVKKYPPETRIAVDVDGLGEVKSYFNDQTNDIQYTRDLELAWATTLAWPKIPAWGSHVYVTVFTETPPDPNAPPPPKPRVPIDKCLRKTVIELLRVAPLNEIARGHAMNDLHQAIPAECQSFEQIQEWVETNCQPANPPKPSGSTRGGRNRNTAFEIEVQESEREYGRCDYSCDRSGSGNVPLSVDGFMEAVEEAIANGEGITLLQEKIEQQLKDDAPDYISMDCDNYEYEQYESGDSDHYELTWTSATLERKIRDWLANNHPDKLEELENNE